MSARGKIVVSGRMPGLAAAAAALILCAACALPFAASAQTPPADELDPESTDESQTPDDEPLTATPTAGIESLKVTGNAGGKVWQDVPNSAVGFDALELQRERIQDISDISNFTPNLEIKTAFAASNPVLFIRGIGLDDFNANSASAVAVYQDGIYMNSPAGQLFQFFDVEGVTVLRGPHAGRYRNASAGAILVTSQRPKPEFSTYGTVTYGEYDLVEAEGAVNVPLIDNLLTSRISGKYVRRDGWTKNRCAGSPLVNNAFVLVRNDVNPPENGCSAVAAPGFSIGGDSDDLERWVNDANSYAVRAQLLFDVPLQETSMDWLLNVHGGQNFSQAAQFQHRGFTNNNLDTSADKIPNGRDALLFQDFDDDPFEGDYNSGGDEELDLFGANLTGRWGISDVHEIHSVSGVEWHDRNTLENTDANPRNLLTSSYEDESWQFSQELRLDSHWSDNFRTNAGAYFLMEDLKVNNQFDLRNSSFVLDLNYTQLLASWALYGEFAWDILDDFTLEGNIRYAQEFKDFENSSVADNASGTAGIDLNADREDEIFEGLAGNVSLTWRFTDDHSVYAKYTRGWKPGHFNGGSVFSAQLIEPVRPEDLNSYEIGFKGSFFDDRLSFDLSAFYYDFKNLQIFALEEDAGSFALPQLINAEGAEVLGAELGLRINPIRGLDLRYDIGYLDTEYTEFTNTISVFGRAPPGEPVPKVPVLLDYTGNTLIGSPTWSMSGSIQYTQPLLFGEWNLGELIPRASFSWKDDTNFGPGRSQGVRQDLPDRTIGQDAYALYNASFGWRSPKQTFELTAWIRNITDKEYRLQSFDLSEGTELVIDAYGAPRTFGLTLGAYF